MIITDPTIKPGEQRNMLLSMTTIFGLSLLFLSARLIATISNIRIIKTSVIRSIKGRSGKKPFVHPGKNFRTVERGIVRIAEVSAAVAVVRFQKNPNRKIDNTPGEIKPTYSCTNW
jgi:hypothetical protein